MPFSKCLMTDFSKVAPQYSSTHQQTLDWIIAAHTMVEAQQNGVPQESEKIQLFREKLTAELYRVGCKPGMINRRGHEIADFNHFSWNEMEIYRLKERSEGVGLQARQKVHAEITERIVEKFYPENSTPPHHLIHVSCTGYSAPNCAQKLVSKRGWGNTTSVLNAYHMGCYSSVPAIRIAAALANQRPSRVDIVHTELCTLHMNPSLHAIDQLVGQSLFADGFIQYSIESEETSEEKSALRILSIHEQILPESQDMMKWLLMDWGFYFLLSHKIPGTIAKHLKDFTAQLCAFAGVDEAEIQKNGVYAIHPGGPKIIDYAEKIFELSPERLFYSRLILQNYGNMSSATLPHIWEIICNDHAIPSGTKILSLAFGPGLTIAGILMEKA
jgi:predicted naringenin-chalcone synthase